MMKIKITTALIKTNRFRMMMDIKDFRDSLRGKCLKFANISIFTRLYEDYHCNILNLTRPLKLYLTKPKE